MLSYHSYYKFTGGSFGRKSRVPRTVKYIPPPSLNYSDVANQSDDPISLSVPNEEGEELIPYFECNKCKIIIYL